MMLNGERGLGGGNGFIMSCHSLADHAKKPDRRKCFNIQTNCSTTGSAGNFQIVSSKVHSQKIRYPSFIATQQPNDHRNAHVLAQDVLPAGRPGVPAQVFGRFGFGVDLEGLFVETEELLEPLHGM